MKRKKIKILLAGTDNTILKYHSEGGFEAKSHNCYWDNQAGIHTAIRDKAQIEKIIQALQAEGGYFVLTTLGKNTARLWCILRSMQIDLEKVLVLGFYEGNQPVLERLDIQYKYEFKIDDVTYSNLSFEEQYDLQDLSSENRYINCCNAIWNNANRPLEIDDCLTILEGILPTKKINFLQNKINLGGNSLDHHDTGKNWHAIIALMLLEAKGVSVSDIVLLENSASNIKAFAKLPAMLRALEFELMPATSAININNQQKHYLKQLRKKLKLPSANAEAGLRPVKSKMSITNFLNYSCVFSSSKRTKLTEDSSAEADISSEADIEAGVYLTDEVHTDNLEYSSGNEEQQANSGTPRLN